MRRKIQLVRKGNLYGIRRRYLFFWWEMYYNAQGVIPNWWTIHWNDNYWMLGDTDEKVLKIIELYNRLTAEEKIITER